MALTIRTLVLAGLFLLSPVLSGAAWAQSLVNGGSVGGSIAPVGDEDSWSFFAAAGQGFQVRASDLNATSLSLRLRIFDPSGDLVTSAQGSTVAAISAIAEETGTYSAVLDDVSLGGSTGSYAIHFVRLPGANELGSLGSEGKTSSSLDLGDLDSFTFTIAAGQHFQLRVADTAAGGMFPRVDIYDPLGAFFTGTSASTVAVISTVAPVGGTYSVVISDVSLGNAATGPYDLYYAALPAAGEDGPLTNGGAVSGSLDLGDLDAFEFSLSAGQTFQLRVADTALTGFFPRVDVYDPLGALFAGTSASTVAVINNVAPVTGTYTVLISDVSLGNAATGPYDIHFAALPDANENGALVNGGVVSGALELGDLDTYKFSIAAGQNFQLRVADTALSGFVPRVDVYDPLGALFTGTSASTVAVIGAVAPVTGTYTVLISDVSLGNAATGPYDIHFAALPDATENGPLTNGGVVSDALELGDLDTFEFTIAAGQNFQLRVADTATGGMVPRVDIYDPLGAFFTGTSGSTVASISAVAPVTGTFSVVIYDVSLGNAATGPYDVHFTALPGANEHGTLPNGGSASEFIDLGDLDTFEFSASAGQNFQLRVADVNFSGLVPRVDVYDPLGAFFTGTSGSTVAAISAVVPVTGTYSVVVRDVSLGNAATGPYEVHFARMPGANEGGVLLDGVSRDDQLDVGDLDSFTFVGTATDMSVVTVTDLAAGGMVPRVDLYGPLGEYLTGGSGSTEASLAFSVVTGGVYTVVVRDVSLGLAGSGAYSIVLTGSGATPGLVANTTWPPQFPTDPILADIGGSAGFGPRIGDAAEPFNFALDCSGADTPSVWIMQALSGVLTTPLPTEFGWLYIAGAPVLTTSGVHAQTAVSWFPSPAGLAIANDAALVGLNFTVQGWVGGYGASGRLSNAISQTIGG